MLQMIKLLMHRYPGKLNQFNNMMKKFYEKIYQKLQLKHLHQSCWMRGLCLFYKELSSKIPKYIHNLILPITHSLGHSKYLKNPFFRVLKMTGRNSTPKFAILPLIYVSETP